MLEGQTVAAGRRGALGRRRRHPGAPALQLDVDVEAASRHPCFVDKVVDDINHRHIYTHLEKSK